MSLFNVRKMFSVSFLLAFLIISSPIWAHPQHVSRQVYHQRRDVCDNAAESRDCWGSYSIDTDYYDVVPDTGVTREVLPSASTFFLILSAHYIIVLASSAKRNSRTGWI
jgi:hypothetical protein